MRLNTPSRHPQKGAILRRRCRRGCRGRSRAHHWCRLRHNANRFRCWRSRAHLCRRRRCAHLRRRRLRRAHLCNRRCFNGVLLLFAFITTLLNHAVVRFSKLAPIPAFQRPLFKASTKWLHYTPSLLVQAAAPCLCRQLCLLRASIWLTTLVFNTSKQTLILCNFE